MKISLALGPRKPLSRQTAWGCLTANLALPGSGSLLAGRVMGYPQLALGGVGMLLTLVFGVRFVIWQIANWSRLHDPQADPVGALVEMWQSVRWAVLGIGLFALSWVWGLATGLAIVRSAAKAETGKVPPRLG